MSDIIYVEVVSYKGRSIEIVLVLHIGRSVAFVLLKWRSVAVSLY